MAKRLQQKEERSHTDVLVVVNPNWLFLQRRNVVVRLIVSEAGNTRLSLIFIG